MLKKILFLLMFILITLKTNAQQITFEAYVNKNSIKENDLIELTIMCIGANLDYEPEIPILKDFEIISQSSSNQMQIINGNIVSSESYIYKLVAKKTGKLIIPPIIGYINNKKYETKPISINVLSERKIEKINDNNITFLKAEISNKEPFLNEQIIYTLKFYRRVNTEKNNLSLPDFKDFIVEDLGKQKDYQTNINGKIYAVTEIRKIIIPNKVGNIKIEPATLLVEIPYKDEDDFWGTSIKKEIKNLKSEGFQIKVKELPNNISDIVSKKINYEVNISSKKMKLGDSVNLSIKFNGEGNIYDIDIENLNIENSKVYQDKANSKNFIKNDKLFSEKVFNYGIVPLKAGKIKINFPKIIYFNTDKKDYEYISIKPLEIDVIEFKSNVKNSEKKENDNIVNIEKKERKNQSDFYKTLVIILILLLLLAIIVIVILIYKQKKKNFERKIIINENPSKNKYEYNILNSEDFDEVYKFFMRFIKDNKVPDEKLKEFNSIEERLYKVKFSNYSNENEKKELIKQVKELINSVFDKLKS